MDPITLIIGALAAGAATGFTETASKAVQDAYAGLKALLRRRFAGRPEAETALEQHEKKPEVWEAPLAEALRETGADEDDEILKAATQLRELLGAAGGVVAEGDHAVAAGGNVGDVVSDSARVVKPYFAGNVSSSSVVTAGGDVVGTTSPEPSGQDLFDPVYSRIRTRPADPDVDSTELLDLVGRIRNEVASAQPNSRRLERWLRDLAEVAPDVSGVLVDALQQAPSGVAERVRDVAARQHR